MPAMAEFLRPFIPTNEEFNANWIDGLAAAYRAAQNSDDPSTQVGAEINGVLGFNRCVDDDPPVIDKNWGRVHAETDAIINCDFTYGGTLCAPWACCTGCAVDILAADISTVVVHLERMLMTPKEWEPEVLSGLRMLVRNGVQLFAVSYDFGVTIRAHGKEVHL
jgi:deoxycytidylate deaminase